MGIDGDRGEREGEGWRGRGKERVRERRREGERGREERGRKREESKRKIPLSLSFSLRGAFAWGAFATRIPSNLLGFCFVSSGACNVIGNKGRERRGERGGDERREEKTGTGEK